MLLSDIAIALPLEDSLLKPLQLWGKKIDWHLVKHVHVIHVVKKSITPFEFGLVEIPDAKAFEDMTPTLYEFLRTETKKILSPEFKGEVSYHLAIDLHPEDEMVRMLKHLAPNMVVVSTQGRHGLEGFFHGSFSEQMVRFAPCDVYVVRP
jgi:nucleotide-binding universal stress UspA family protein